MRAVAAAAELGYPGGREAVRRRDRAQDRARARAARPRATRDAVRDARRTSCSPRRGPTTAPSSCSSRRWCAAHRELIAGLVRDPQFGPCVMLGVGGVLAEALGDVAFRVVPLDRARRRRADRRPRDPEAARPVPRRARGRPRRARARCSLGLSRARGRARPTSRSVDVNPLIVVDGTPGRGRRAGRARRPRRVAARRTRRDAVRDDEGFARAVRAARRRSSPARRRIPGSSGSSRCTTSSPAGYAGEVGATNLEAAPVLGVDTVREHRRAARRAVGPRVRVHARGRQRRAPARVRAERGVARRVPHERRLRRGGRRRAGAPSASSSRSPTSSASCSPGPNGQGVVSTPAHAVRADRRALPAARAGSRSRASRATSCRRSRTGPCRPAWA